MVLFEDLVARGAAVGDGDNGVIHAMGSPHGDGGASAVAVGAVEEEARHWGNGTEHVAHLAADVERHRGAVAESDGKDASIVNAVLGPDVGEDGFGEGDVLAVGIGPFRGATRTESLRSDID